MSERGFWRLSPRQFVALRKAWDRDQERLDYRFALVASAAANAPHYQREDKRPYTPQDFILSSGRKKRALNPAQMAALIEANNVMLSGVDARLTVVRASDEEKRIFLAKLKAR